MAIQVSGSDSIGAYAFSRSFILVYWAVAAGEQGSDCPYKFWQIKKKGAEYALVYDQNHYFGLAPKPKLADTFGRYRNQYGNYILKRESSYR